MGSFDVGRCVNISILLETIINIANVVECQLKASWEKASSRTRVGFTGVTLKYQW